MTTVDDIRGKGRNKLNVSVDTVSKKSICNITNKDNLCLFRAIVVGATYLQKGKIDAKIFKRVSQAIRTTNRQRDKTLELLSNTIKSVPPNGCGFQELEKIQNYFINNEIEIAIVVYEKSFFGHSIPPIFDGHKMFQNNKISTETINLLYDERDKHYDTILNLVGAGGDRYFCWQCNKAYRTLNGHRCNHSCARCFESPNCDNTEPKIVCNKCNREF